MSKKIVQVTSPAPRKIWEEILQADEDALVFQTPQWLDAACEAANYEDASRLYETEDGNQMVMPLVRTKMRPLFLATQASHPPAWGMGGLISKRPLQSDDISAVFGDLMTLPVLQTSIRPNPLHGKLWSDAAPSSVVKIPRISHVLKLSDDFETVWSGFKGTARTAIRKAEKAGLTVECDTTGKLVPIFYDLLVMSFDRWATNQNEPLLLARWRGKKRDSLEKFQTITRILGDACRIWVAWLDDQPVASILVLQGKNVNYTRGAMNRDLANKTRSNDLLHKLALEDAVRSGCRYYHMGETGQSNSLAQFKERFGAEPAEYAEYRIERVPITRMDTSARTFVKRLIGFKDHD